MTSPELTPYDITRYGRQILLFGEESQRKLKGAHIFVAGAGGLGSPLCTYLAVAGIGHLHIVDFDVVDWSNLNRQILHWDKDVGHLKVQSAVEKLHQMNPSIKVRISQIKIDETNVESLVGDADGIADCMDNFPTRYLLNRTAIRKRIPFFHGAIYGMEARVSTFIPGETACLRCLFPEVPPPSSPFPVIGATPGIAATIQTMEIIKYLTRYGTPLKNRMLVFDGEAGSFIELKLQRDANCQDCGSLNT